MATLTGKTALVTGASRGIGRASALALAAAGAPGSRALRPRHEGSRRCCRRDTQSAWSSGFIATDLAAADGASKLARQNPAALSEIAWTSLSSMQGS